jgi:hypothetical protein
MSDERVALNFFWADTAWYGSLTVSCFYLRFKVVDPYLLPSDDPWRKAFTISILKEEQIWTHFFPHSFVRQSAISRGTKQKHTFEYPKASIMLLTLHLDTESSVPSSLVVSVGRVEWVHQYAGATPIIGRPERRTWARLGCSQKQQFVKPNT